ncbi:hypothetical protein GE061_006281 [Apolygus lucorum]|uniref:Uncharacterized protein n=1 Tax=Apolygus lucorum TaxID=248454 RepID=A0A8S9WTG9_APOLU|nr:hypothetical protein GE061_006281 [Apolygus lucorum]
MLFTSSVLDISCLYRQRRTRTRYVAERSFHSIETSGYPSSGRPGRPSGYVGLAGRIVHEKQEVGPTDVKKTHSRCCSSEGCT